MNGLIIKKRSMLRGTFGTSIFLIGMYRLGIFERASRTVRSRASAINPENTPYIHSVGFIRRQTVAT